MPLSNPLAPWMSAGWTWSGPTEIDGCFELRAAELPDFLVAGATAADVLADLDGALRAYFESYDERGQALPLLPSRWSLRPVAKARREMEAQLRPSGEAPATVTKADLVTAAA